MACLKCQKIVNHYSSLAKKQATAGSTISKDRYCRLKKADIYDNNTFRHAPSGGGGE